MRTTQTWTTPNSFNRTVFGPLFLNKTTLMFLIFIFIAIYLDAKNVNLFLGFLWIFLILIENFFHTHVSQVKYWVFLKVDFVRIVLICPYNLVQFKIWSDLTFFQEKPRITKPFFSKNTAWWYSAIDAIFTIKKRWLSLNNDFKMVKPILAWSVALIWFAMLFRRSL